MNSDLLSIATPAARHREIARRAHQLWKQYGRPVGCDLDIWLTAEAMTPDRDADLPAEDLLDDGIRLQELRDAFPEHGEGQEPIQPRVSAALGRDGRTSASRSS